MEARLAMTAPKPAAYRRADDLNAVPAGAARLYEHAVGVRVTKLYRVKAKLQPGLLRVFKALRDTLIIGGEAEKPGDERHIRAVPAPRGGEGAVKVQLRPHRRAAEELPRDKADAHGPRGVRAGRPDHYGAYYIQYIHKTSPK